MNKHNLYTYSVITQKLLSQFADDTSNNVVFSPFSVIILLAILADATGGETCEEIAKALGCEKDSDEIIDWISQIQEKLMNNGALVSSNAVCINDEIKDKIVSGYEKHLKELFGGRLFATKDMISAVNEWVNKNTKGMIPQIVDESMSSMLACLMNAIAFDAQWKEKYDSLDIDSGDFNNSDGTCSEVTMMRSMEWQYIEDSEFTGFTKPYKDVGYSYMALLPKKTGSDFRKRAVENIDFIKLFNSKKHKKVVALVPEYKLEFGEKLSEFCKKIGIEKVFSDRADFRPVTDEWLKVEEIIHKAFIRVDTDGTKAGAVTAAALVCGCAPDNDFEYVELDRPFVFAIVHDETGLPVFAGVVNHLEECSDDLGYGD